jgi:hypothetical protein
LFWGIVVRGVLGAGGDSVAGTGGTVDIGGVVTGMAAIGRGWGVGLGATAIGAVVTGGAAGTCCARGVIAPAAVGIVRETASGSFRCIEPPAEAMGVKSTPIAASAPPITRSFVRLSRIALSFVSTTSRQIGGCPPIRLTSRRAPGSVFNLVLSLTDTARSYNPGRGFGPEELVTRAADVNNPVHD